MLEGKEMEDSSDTDEESEGEEAANSETRDKEEKLEEGDGDEGERSSEEREGGKAEELSVVNNDPSAATSLKKSHKIKFRDEEAVKKVVLADKRGEKVREKKEGSVQKEEEKDKGKTLMELLELEMRARAIKALLMKAGKEEGEAETLAIEEALDEAKKKEKEVKTAAKESKKADAAVAETVAAAEAPADDAEEDDDDEEPPEKVYNSNNAIMSKARDALMLSESKKLIADQVKPWVQFRIWVNSLYQNRWLPRKRRRQSSF